MDIPQYRGNSAAMMEQEQVGIACVPSEGMQLDPREFQFNFVMAQRALGAFGVGSGLFDGILSPRIKDSDERQHDMGRS